MRTYGSHVLDLGVARAPGVAAPASKGRNEGREGGGRSFTETRTHACTAAVGASARWIFMISSAFSAFRMEDMQMQFLCLRCTKRNPLVNELIQIFQVMSFGAIYR